ILILLLALNLLESQHYTNDRNDLHERFISEYTRHGPEDTCTDRLRLAVQEHCSVAVEANDRTIRTAYALAGAHDDGIVVLALLYLAAGNGIPDAHLDDVADTGVAPVRTTQHLDALQVASAAVVGRIEECLHLDHGFTSALFIDNAA